MNFPKSEAQIIALCDHMRIGYYLHRMDFPKINRSKLSTSRLSYINAKKSLVEARARLKIETKVTNEKLLELKKVMRNCLRKSEVDVANNPEKLTLIGWAPKGNNQPVQLPAQPTNLQIITNEGRTVTLKWDRPEDDQRVRNYCLERRQQNSEGFSDWIIVHIPYSTQTTLRNQPLGIYLEYKVKAANTAGVSLPSNTVAVIL